MFAAGALESVTSKKIRLSDSDDDLMAHNGKNSAFMILGLKMITKTHFQENYYSIDNELKNLVT